ncbi:MAG TPA: alpha/beta hydrolase [Phycisphaerae bacterium]|jgi:acetyl esterase/lipase|nr:alpha/beta hydrolase [Phycisphaerae bacterium]HOB74270.1 alpha/beta hydrolase [Phycisphaerae bacterium]HOJ53139.1 alpha/beta hydrolase [Phycisphaerae bacterium]HOL24876.1 alpha/beta hydrolase [Phycisphaerae bacterium]HPP19412.1 alpha/beta hydrolase [Phycisphaerae bacterium]
MLHKNVFTLGLLSLLIIAPAGAQEPATSPPTIPLWPNGVPGAVGNEAADKPTLTIHLPPADKATGAAVVICPGGGYAHLAVEKEGTAVARWLNSLGVAGFVLQYRLAPRYRHPAPLQDAQRAIRTVRARADEWKINPNQIGIMGFSAGGHLASTAGTHFDAGNASAEDRIERVSSRPDFLILCYPVITFTEPKLHRGSRSNLIGDPPDPKLIEELSSEKQVTPQTPPTFLFHTDADTGVPPENSVLFYLALRKAKVPAELHIYQPGPHGVGLAANDPFLRSWPERCADWMRLNGWVKPRTATARENPE